MKRALVILQNIHFPTSQKIGGQHNPRHTQIDKNMKLSVVFLCALVGLISLEQSLVLAATKQEATMRRGSRDDDNGHQRRKTKSKSKEGKGGGSSTSIPYTPPCDSFLIFKDRSGDGPIYAANPDHSFQLLQRDHEGEGWCSSVGCSRTDEITFAVFGEKIDNGFKIEIAGDDLTFYYLMCPFGGLVPTVTSTACGDGELTAAPSNDVSFVPHEGGPWARFEQTLGCQYFKVTVECTSDDADYLEKIFKKAKKCEGLGERPYSENKFLVTYDSSNTNVAFFVDGVDYTVEALSVDGADSGWCIHTGCNADQWSAYVNGVDIDDGTKYVMSATSPTSGGHNWNSFFMVCPYADQTPILETWHCNAGSATLGNFVTSGPVIDDIDFALDNDCDILTVEIHCVYNDNLMRN